MKPQDLNKLGVGTELVISSSCIFKNLRGKRVHVSGVNIQKGLVHVKNEEYSQQVTLIPSDVEFPHG